MQVNTTRLLSLEDTAGALGLKKTALHGRVDEGLFPTPIVLNSRVKRWPDGEVQRLVSAHAAGLDDTAIKALVVRLHTDRARAASALLAA